MRNLFKKRSEREKFKKIERQMKKGLWPFVLKAALFWGGYMALCHLFIDFTMRHTPLTLQETALKFFISLIFGLPLGFWWWSRLKKDYANYRRSWKIEVWGSGIFDNDATCDAINTAIHQDLSIATLISNALHALPNEKTKSDQAYDVILACAMSHAIINKVIYTEIDDLEVWLAKQDIGVMSTHKTDLVKALEAVLNDQSDLKDQWSENKEQYPIWLSHVKGLHTSLSTA